MSNQESNKPKGKGRPFVKAANKYVEPQRTDASSTAEPNGDDLVTTLKSSGLPIVTAVIEPASESTPEPTPESTTSTPADRIKLAIRSGPKEEAQIAAQVAIGRNAVNQTYSGLSPEMRAFLYNRALCDTDSEALRAMGMTGRAALSVLANWQRIPAFSRAYGSIFVDPLSFSNTMLETLLPLGIGVLEELLRAPSLKDKAKGLELLFKSQGLLKPQTESNNETDRALANLLHERGFDVPPLLRHYLPSIEGSYREIQTEDSQPPS